MLAPLLILVGFEREKTEMGCLGWMNMLIAGAEKPSEKNCYNY